MNFQFFKVISGLFLCLLMATGAAAQGQKNPTFAQYAAKKMTTKPAPVNLKSNPHANEFRTRLKEAVSGGVNFAGSFIIALWGCGTGCSSGAVINARTGTVYFPDELAGSATAVGDWAGEKEPVDFKPNSRLLIIRGKPGNGGDAEGISYFEWTGKAFRKIKFVAVTLKGDQ